jgi:YVTN family beta-propeller protein
MDRFNADLDRQLGDWLREESATRASAGLVEAVFARTSRTRQLRRWWPPVSPVRSPRTRPHVVGAEKASRWWSGSALAGAVGIVVLVTVVAFTLRSIGPGPGTQGGPSASPSPSPELTPSPSPTPSPSVLAPLPSPRATFLDGTAAQVLRLGIDAGPIDVVEAFGSIWTANIHSNDVSRLDPTTLEELARIPAGTGPAWFAVTDDALWVTNQLGSGLVGIDPATNAVVAAIGEAQPCGAPVLTNGSLWASACDSNVILRIDTTDLADIATGRRFPSNEELLSKITAPGYRWLAVADGRLFTGNAAGLAEVDPTTETVTDLGFCCGDVMGSDGQTVWLNRSTDVIRMDVADGTIVATFPYANAGSVTFLDGRAWLTVSGGGVIEIDIESNDILRTIPVPGSTLVAREAAGALWVTSFDTSELWRIEP